MQNKRVLEVLVGNYTTLLSCLVVLRPSKNKKNNCFLSLPASFFGAISLFYLSPLLTLISVADPDLQIRGRGGGGGHPDPEIRPLGLIHTYMFYLFESYTINTISTISK